MSAASTEQIHLQPVKVVPEACAAMAQVTQIQVRWRLPLVRIRSSQLPLLCSFSKASVCWISRSSKAASSSFSSPPQWCVRRMSSASWSRPRETSHPVLEPVSQSNSRVAADAKIDLLGLSGTHQVKATEIKEGKIWMSDTLRQLQSD
jgi:hypothetical protein